MDLRQGFRELTVGFLARSTRARPSSATASAFVVIFALVATQVVVAQCKTTAHAFSTSTVVPCQNATCAYWGMGVPGIPTPTCVNPSGITVSSVSVTVTSTAWYRCVQVSSTAAPSCTEVLTSCADYAIYGDWACTVFCKTVQTLPYYCKGP